MMDQAFDGDVLQEPCPDGESADDQGCPVPLGQLGCHRGSDGAVVSLHVPYDLCRRAGLGGAVGLDHPWRHCPVAHMGLGQHWGTTHTHTHTFIVYTAQTYTHSALHLT